MGKDKDGEFRILEIMRAIKEHGKMIWQMDMEN